MGRQFSDCCAADTLRYFDEVPRRLGGGAHDEYLSEWLRDFIKKPMFGTRDITDRDGMQVVIIESKLVEFTRDLDAKIQSEKGEKR